MVLHRIVLYCIALHYSVLYCIVVYCIVLHCIVAYCRVLCLLYCVLLYRIALYCQAIMRILKQLHSSVHTFIPAQTLLDPTHNSIRELESRWEHKLGT